MDRDVVWLLQDWRLQSDAQISNDFGNMHDMAHNGTRIVIDIPAKPEESAAPLA